MVNYFCAKCGKTIEDIDKKCYKEHFICKECYLKQSPLFKIEKHFKLYICPHCSSYMFDNPNSNEPFNQSSGNMIKDIGDAFFSAILSPIIDSKNIHFDLNFDLESFKKSNENYVECNLIGKDLKENVEKEQVVTFKIKKSTCPSCSQIKGHRYEAVIQLRISQIKKYEPTILFNELNNFMENLRQKNAKLFITEIKETTNGYDLRLSSKALLNKINSFISDKYHVIKKFSKKLIGTNPNTGGKLYRPYLLLKLIPIKTGDVFQLYEKQYLITKILPNRIKLDNMKTGKKSTKKLTFFEKRNLTFKFNVYNN
ncbi:MAG: hypothetical protein GF364_14365 [Candidatus Lokiarchaeota archaeon]|nr:hypothetical protein [Candidatus Lokiarchaeota archaeon]